MDSTAPTCSCQRIRLDDVRRTLALMPVTLPLSVTGRLRLARFVVDDGWPLRSAVDRFDISVTAAKRWATATGSTARPGWSTGPPAPGSARAELRPGSSDAPSRPSRRSWGPPGSRACCGKPFHRVHGPAPVPDPAAGRARPRHRNHDPQHGPCRRAGWSGDRERLCRQGCLRLLNKVTERSCGGAAGQAGRSLAPCRDGVRTRAGASKAERSPGSCLIGTFLRASRRGGGERRPFAMSDPEVRVCKRPVA